MDQGMKEGPAFPGLLAFLGFHLKRGFLFVHNVVSLGASHFQ